MSNFKIINEGKSPENLVVFIHGFTGTHNTWEKKDGSMPFITPFLIVNPSIKESYAIRHFSYKSSLFGGNKSDTLLGRGLRELKRTITGNQNEYNQDIDKIALHLKTEIDLYREEKGLSQVKLTLIAHSMGGLVCKCFILNNINDKSYHFRAFHSIHVPHQGSELAMIANLTWSNGQKTGLKPNSELTKILNDRWLDTPVKKLPYTYYYLGTSDETVLRTSAFGSEKRKGKSGFEKIEHNGGHSDFLENTENAVFRKVAISLRKDISLEESEQVLTKLQKTDAKVSISMQSLYEEVDMLYPQCKEFTCFRFNRQTLFDDIYNYTNAMSDELNDFRDMYDTEIDFVFDAITAYLTEDAPFTFEKLYFSYEGVYKHIFEYIDKNVLHQCNCEVRAKFDLLIQNNLKAELAFC
jgi:hypothetical protein